MASPSRKLPTDIWWLDAQEHRPENAFRCHTLALVILAVSFAFDLIMVMDFSRSYQIAQFSQDEYWFLEEIMKLQNLLMTGDLGAIRNFGSPFAYGFGFWLFTAVIGLPLKGHLMLLALFLRLFFMATKYAAFWVVYRRAYDLTHKPIFSVMLLTLLLAIPAYVFDGKIIGPEFLIMLLVALGWDSMFRHSRNGQTASAFFFGMAAIIKINLAALGILFIAIWWMQPKAQRFGLVLDWIIGLIVPFILFIFPADPFREIFAIAATHHVSYGLTYMIGWYNYNALEFDDMLKGGWRIDFMSWPFIFVLIGYAIYQDITRAAWSREWTPTTIPAIVWGLYAGLIACILTSLNSLMHPWFVFAPFLLFVSAGCYLIGLKKQGTTVMAVFLLVYIGLFGPRYIERWQHRQMKFEYVAQTEFWNADVSSWIEKNCPTARQGVIDYNLMWPETYNRQLKQMWTLIEVEDFRRIAGDATSILDNVDLLLIKAQRMKAFLPKASYKPQPKIAGSILGNFFPNTEPYFYRTHEFPDLTLYAREGVCKK